MYDTAYDDIEFVMQKAQELLDTEELTTIPPIKSLRKRGYKDLAYAIERKHRGVVRVRNLIDAPQLRVKRGKWKKLEFRITMAKVAMSMDNTETLQCKSRLDKLGMSSLVYAISRYDKGFKNFRKALLEEDKQEKIKKYEDMNYGLEIARQIKQRFGFPRLPCDKKLRELGYSTLAFFIYSRYGGIEKFRQMLGESKITRQKGSLKDIDYVDKEVLRIMQENNLAELPKKDDLALLDSSLAHAIVKYFGYKEYRGGFEQRIAS